MISGLLTSDISLDCPPNKLNLFVKTIAALGFAT